MCIELTKRQVSRLTGSMAHSIVTAFPCSTKRTNKFSDKDPLTACANTAMYRSMSINLVGDRHGPTKTTKIDQQTIKMDKQTIRLRMGQRNLCGCSGNQTPSQRAVTRYW